MRAQCYLRSCLREHNERKKKRKRERERDRENRETLKKVEEKSERKKRKGELGRERDRDRESAPIPPYHPLTSPYITYLFLGSRVTCGTPTSPSPVLLIRGFGWVRFGWVRFGSVRLGSVGFGSVRLGSVRFGWTGDLNGLFYPYFIVFNPILLYFIRVYCILFFIIFFHSYSHYI